MNILFSVHLYPPTHNCGGEYYVHNLAKFLISKGHSVRVLLHQADTYGIKTVYEYEGVMVFPPHQQIPEHLASWSTHMLTHLEYAPWTIQLAHIFKVPFFFISHNTHVYECITNARWPLNVIYNSNWMRDVLQYEHRSMVLHPPLSLDKIVENNNPWENEFITIINCNERKGGSLAAALAERMPDRKFLFVKGSYDDQIIPEHLPNVTWIENSPDIKPVYARTRILIMPSAYESWGSTATEAMANGIPVIAFATPGLKENIQDAGFLIDSPNFQRWSLDHEKPCFGYFDKELDKWIYFLDDSDVDLWVKQIKKLDSKKLYFSTSEKARARAKELDPLLELEQTEKFLQDAHFHY